MTHAYIRAAVEREVAALASTGDGGRGLKAFAAAAALGGLVGAGALDHESAEEALVSAAMQAGMEEREAIGHVRRGLKRGEAEPRTRAALRAVREGRAMPEWRRA